ncbi:hypothetical protein GRI89_10980 [Altererythrobacter salegens]|uniref:Rap1a immunity protein domain-containing protein n=1 Tax=Croceibacterium salegens TaxID=1737568 RepID=A0A6I4T0B6_9SPHN|nr:Rap1a/Tai family immunity protein [Croceibacterium salegens]MXO60062.1 hypothetical protein [Croceibacterium salegens]
MRFLPLAVAATLAALFAFAAPAQAAFMDGNRLHFLCNAQDDRSQAICGGYILGVIEALQYDDETENLEPFACPEDDTTVPEFEAAVLDYLDDNPDELGESGASLVALALMQAYPCGD